MNITITHNRYIYIMKIMLQLQSSAVFSCQSRTGLKYSVSKKMTRPQVVRSQFFFIVRTQSGPASLQKTLLRVNRGVGPPFLRLPGLLGSTAVLGRQQFKIRD